MRLSLIHSFLFLLFAASALSQPLGNEWIDYSEKHLKIPVWEDGVNSLNFQDLSQAFSGIGESRLEVKWDGTSFDGEQLSSGTYFYRFSSEANPK